MTVEPTDNDVIFEKGNKSKKHPGNKYYRTLVNAHLSEFDNRKTNKGIISKLVYDEITSSSRRFLQKLDNGSYVVLDDTTAIYKIGQRFRDEKRGESQSQKNPSLKINGMERADTVYLIEYFILEGDDVSPSFVTTSAFENSRDHSVVEATEGDSQMTPLLTANGLERADTVDLNNIIHSVVEGTEGEIPWAPLFTLTVNGLERADTVKLLDIFILGEGDVSRSSGSASTLPNSWGTN